MIYSEKIKVKYSEVNANGILTPTALVNYFQDITMFHSNEVANTVDILEKKDWGWVLSAWQIDVYRKLRRLMKSCYVRARMILKGGWGLGIVGFRIRQMRLSQRPIHFGLLLILIKWFQEK